MQLLDGKLTSQQMKDEIKAETQSLVSGGRRLPKLAALLVGDNPASHTYVRHKIKACAYVGFSSICIEHPASISENKLLDELERLNNDPEIDGIIVQMPLPEQISAQTIIEHIRPDKDVDGFHPYNVGMVTLNYDGMLPATPAGVLELIDRYQIPTKGKHVVVAGRSRIVGRPLSILMSRGGQPGEATVSLCHKYTPPELLKKLALQADILIVAVGIPGLITEDMVKEGAVVIDVGITRVADASRKSGFRLKGDVDFDKVAPKTSYITPVPGGVGPMTVAMLLRNTLQAYKSHIGVPETNQ